MRDTKITKEMLQSYKSGQLVEGLILCKGYKVAKTKTGSDYIQGSLQSGVEVPFKAWGNSTAFTNLTTEEYAGSVVMITGKYDVYNDVASIILNTVVAVDVPVDDFLEQRYDVAQYWEALKALVRRSVSDKAYAIAECVLFNNEALATEFKKAFAASSHHDNCIGGLMAHTYKVMLHGVTVRNLYPQFFASQDVIDLFFLGILFHDIGKTQENKLGVYQHAAIVTHRYLGIEMLDRDAIIQGYGYNGWLEIVAIMLQHHGEFDDKARTLLAYLVFLCDNMDSKLTLLQQSMEGGVSKVRIDDIYLETPVVGA